MAVIAPCRARVFILFIFTLVCFVIDAVNDMVKVEGDLVFQPSSSCSSSTIPIQVDNKTKEDFAKIFADQVNNTSKEHVVLETVGCSSDANNVRVGFAIVIPAGTGPSEDDFIAGLRGFRDSDEAQQHFFNGLKTMGLSGETVDGELGMWKCTPSMDCTSLTGYTGNYVRFTLGVNTTTVPPLALVTDPPKEICTFDMMWILKDLEDTVGCGAQAGIIFGGIGSVLICCPLLCWICRERQKKIMKHICAYMDPDFLSTGNEAHSRYWWTEEALEAEETKALRDDLRLRPDPDTKLKQSQMSALMNAKKAEQIEDPEEMLHAASLEKLLEMLLEKGYITTVDPKEEKPEEPKEEEHEPVAKAHTLYERAIQKGAEEWKDSFLKTWGSPSFRDGEQVEFYSIRNVCWLTATVRVFVYDPSAQMGHVQTTQTSENTKLERSVGTERKIVYGVEMQTTSNPKLFEDNNGFPPRESTGGSRTGAVGTLTASTEEQDMVSMKTEQGHAQWRYNIGLEQLRLPLEQGEAVEVCQHGDGVWVEAQVDGPRLENRLNIGGDVFRQQLCYNVRTVHTDERLRTIPAERIRRRFDAGSQALYYHGPESGWVTATVKDDPYGGEGMDDRAAPLQPWNLVHAGRQNNTDPHSPKQSPKHKSSIAKANASIAWKVALKRAGSTQLAEDPTAHRVNIWTWAQIAMQGDDHPSSIGKSVASCLLRPHPEARARNSKWL